MTATKLDTLPSELLSHICETIYHSHKSSLNSLSLVNKTCSLAASELIFRDIIFSYDSLQYTQFVLDCEKWSSLLSRRACLESVRYLHVYSACNRPPSLCDRKALLQNAEWQIDGPDQFAMHYLILHTWGDHAYSPLAELIQRLTYLTTLHWEVVEELPGCILETVVRQRSDLRLVMPDWTLHCLDPGTLRPAQQALITSPRLKSLTAQTYHLENFNPSLLLQTLSSANPCIEEVRIVKCEVLSHFSNADDLLYEKSGDFERLGNKKQAKLTSFSIHGNEAIEGVEAEEWFRAADMSSLQRLELRSGLRGLEVWDTTMRRQPFPDLKHILLGFEFDCFEEEYDAALKWLLDLHTNYNTTLQSLSVRAWIRPDILFDILKPHSHTLRSLAIEPSGASFRSARPILESDIRHLASMCPLLENLTIPIKRGPKSPSSDNEALQYAALGLFPNLANLHIILDIAHWGEWEGRSLVLTSDDTEFHPNEYHFLGLTSITYGHLHHVFKNGATDEKLARQIWSIITSQKAGIPLGELWIEPRGSMELVHGYRPDDHPELASQFVDLYAILRELGRSYKIRPHVRDDVKEVVISEPPGQLPRGYWSGLSDELRVQGETVCHLDGDEMKVFRRLWPGGPGSKSWKDDWESCVLDVSELKGKSDT